MANNFNGYEACRLWCAAKAHYLSKDYDIVKYNWAFNLKEETFRLRRDRFTIERISREYGDDEPAFKHALGFYLYNNPKAMSKGMLQPNLKVNEAVYRFKNLYKTVETELRGSKKITRGWLIDYFLQGKLSPETVIVCMDFLEIKELGPPLPMFKRLPKYAAFIAYDKAKMWQIVRSHLL